MAERKSRAEYFKKRREEKDLVQFCATIDGKRARAIAEKLSKNGMTKRKWIEQKIDEDMKDQGD